MGDDLNSVVVEVPILAVLALVFLIVLGMQGGRNDKRKKATAEFREQIRRDLTAKCRALM
jgi:hypothetical protein